MEFKQSLSREVFERKYCLHGEKSPEEVFLRVSKEIASVEKEDVREYWEKVFYDAIASGTFIPAGRQLANAGPDSLMKNYNNCFTIDLWDSMTGIFVPLSEDAYISQVGGGVGFNASKLRPRFATISKGGYSTGVMSFLVIFDASAKSIHTGGGRRSAHIAVLDVWHPDILEFINFKKGRENDALTQFNISVGITDEFMKAVKNDEDWQLVFPLMKHEKEEEHETVWKKNPFDEEYAISEGYKLDGNGNVLMKVYNTIKATELYDEMAKQAWWYNEPGALFLDTIEKDNNAPHKFKIDRCNPCVSGDTLVAVADGRGSVSFEQLVKEGKDVPVFCKDGDGRTVIRTMRNPRITGYDKDIYKITLDDGSVIKCNDSHKLFTKNEEYERADTLSVGDYVWVNTKDETTHYKIASIEIIGKENVYNGTVDEFHNYNTVVLNTETKSGKGKMVMVNNKNCGEITMGSYELCCLSSINLSTLVRNPFTDNSSFDFDEFRKYVGIGIRFLDNVISATDYPIEKIKVNALNRRRLGLGITGLGDALIKLGIRYGSKESIEFMDKLGNQMANTAYLTSSNLAEEKGSFPEFDEEIGKHGFIPKLDEDVQESIRVKGLRNIGLLTTAPTGTTSLTLGNNCSSGIEPIFSLQYERTVRQDDGSDKKDIVYDYGWLEYLEFAKENGIEVDVNNLPDWLVTSHQIPIKEGIDVQSAFQKWIDHSISKCVAKGTLISTNKGIIPIEKLSDTKYEKEDSFGELNDEYYVFDEYGNKQKVISHYFNGVKDGIEITFSNGSKITGSNEHKLKTDNGWKKLSEIKEGDYVLYRKNCNLNDVNILNEIPQPNFYNNIERKFPKFMTKEFAKFLGMFVADGFTTKNGFGIVEKDEYVKKEVERLFNILFGGSKISVDKRSGVRSHLINSRAIAGLFDTWIGKGCVNKKVPDEIMKSNHEVQIAFLEGVTLDGYIAQSNTLVLYEGYSEKLTEQISIMCQDLGIRNYIGTKKVKNGRLSNVSYSVRIFPESKIINPIEEHKKNYSCNFRKKEMLLVESGDREYYLNNLPSTKNKDYFSFRNLKRALKNSNFVSRGLLEKSCGVDKLDKELLGIKVVNAKEVKDVELYDIEVENTHSYLINGIISHNTVNMPFETTLDEYKDIFMYAWENNLKGVTSFHEGASMDGILTTTKTTEKEELWKTIEVLKNSTRRPEELPCDIYEIQVNKEPVIVLVGRNPEAPYNNAPYEIFYTDNSDGLFNMGRAKEGKIVKIKDGKNKPSRYDLVVESKRSRLVLEDLAQAFNDDYATICRYISLALRHQIPVEFVHDQANKVKRFGTFQKAIARVLKNYIPDGEAISAEKHVCPECEGQMVFEGGCVICKNCGFSACG